MKIVVQAKDEATAFNRLRVAGLMFRDQAEGEPPLPREYLIERCLTPTLTTADGKKVFTVDVEEERVSKLPPQDNPNFAIIWREDVLVEAEQSYEDEDGNIITETYQTQAPWPMFTVNTYDEDGNVNGTTQQGAGRIM